VNEGHQLFPEGLLSSIHVNLGRGHHVNIALPLISSVGEQVSQERLCTIREISRAWQLSEDAVRRLFRNEPGVLVFKNATKFGKRRYTTVRIPVLVVERVRQRYEIPVQLSWRNASGR
jgi:hypothetical protein